MRSRVRAKRAARRREKRAIGSALRAMADRVPSFGGHVRGWRECPLASLNPVVSLGGKRKPLAGPRMQTYDQDGLAIMLESTRYDERAKRWVATLRTSAVFLPSPKKTGGVTRDRANWSHQHQRVKRGVTLLLPRSIKTGKPCGCE